MSGDFRPYVILHHTGHGPEHWDFMLDIGEVLATWQLLADVRSLAGGEALGIAAKRIVDHRRAWLDIQGPVSGGRGEVRRIDQGVYALEFHDERTWRFALRGGLLTGGFELRRGLLDDWVLTRADTTAHGH